MKIKSFAMVAVSSLLAASLAYVAPAMADDSTGSSDNNQTMQSTPSDNTGANNTGSSPSDMGGANSGGSQSTDEGGSPDTATGDDDY